MKEKKFKLNSQEMRKTKNYDSSKESFSDFLSSQRRNTLFNSFTAVRSLVCGQQLYVRIKSKYPAIEVDARRKY